MKRLFFVIWVSISATTFTVWVHAGEDFFVSPSGSNTHPYSSWATAAHDIQDAVDAASPSDRVVIGDGNYEISTELTISKAITVESLNGASAVTVDAGDNGRVMNVSHAGAVIRGLTVTGGNAGVDQGGGGILLSSAATVDSCSILDNQASGGGGLYCLWGGVITNCVVSGNNASASWETASVYGGGGIKANGPVHITMCEISYNTSLMHGGGAHIYMDDFGDPGIMELCHIHHNSTPPNNGGGVYVGWLCILRNSLVHHNTASGGGGIYATSGASVESCTVTENTAEYYGSGRGGGIYIEYADMLRNTIAWNNSAATSEPDIRFSPDDSFISYLCSPVGAGAYAVTQSPEFSDPLNYGYSLTGGSSCINAGTNSSWMAEAVDLGGDSRIIGGTVDIGAYEYTPKELAGQFSADPVSGTVPLTVQFSSSVQGTNLNGLVYYWDFDGDASWDLIGDVHDAPQHTYTVPGSYTVAFEVVNSAAESSFQIHSNMLSVIPDTVYVSPSGANVYPYDSWETAVTDIGTAVGMAGDGTRVIVTNGTYLISAQLNLNKGVRVESVNGAGATYIRPVAMWNHRGFNITHGDAVVEGFTIYFAGTGSGTYDGGGVFLKGGALLRDCIVSNCMSWTGGGVCIESDGYMTGCLVTQCDAAYGGGIYLKWGGAVSNCVVRNNDAYWSNPLRGAGGGIELNGGSVVNTLVYSNRALEFGSGIRIRYNSTVINTTVVDNRPFFGGDVPGGIYCNANNLIMRNCIVWSNATDSVIIATGNHTFEYCCFDEDIGGTGNLNQDPRMVNSPKGPYRIGSASPCVDTGTASGAPDRDLDGFLRPIDGNGDSSALHDIGASEYAPPSLDSDGDTLSDYDEVYIYKTSPKRRDSDGDGMDDNQELIAGSDPNAAGDVFVIGAAGSDAAGSGFVIAWNSSTGRVYTLRGAPGLNGPWDDVPGCIDLDGTGGTMSWTNSTPAGTRFYVLQVRLAE